MFKMTQMNKRIKIQNSNNKIVLIVLNVAIKIKIKRTMRNNHWDNKCHNLLMR